MRALSKVAINCLKPSPFDTAEQIFRLHLEAVEGEFVFLHAAIAEHADLAAAHAGGGEGVGCACRAAFRRGTSRGRDSRVEFGSVPREQRHHVGAGRMGDPGLVAGDR